MKKNRDITYIFDKENGVFVEVDNSRVKRNNIFKTILVVALSSFVTLGGAYSYFQKDSTKNLATELNKLKKSHKLLIEKFSQTTDVLKEIENKDNDLYRSYFNLEELSEDIRKAGYGGVKRYTEFSEISNSDLVFKAHEDLDKLNKRLIIESESLNEIIKVAAQRENNLSFIPAIQPVANKHLKRMASGYGYRVHPILKIKKMHWGTDFAAPTGTPIYATADADVAYSSRMGGCGKTIKLDHGNGYQTLYAHMSKRVVKKGQKVKRGDIIGYVGSTGMSSGPHLHYEVHKNGKKVNPHSYFVQGISPDDYVELHKQSQVINQSYD